MSEIIPMEIIWRPTPETAARARIARFMARYGIGSLAALHRRSLEDPEWFWDAVARDLGLEWLVPYRGVLDTSRGIAWPRWFDVRMPRETGDVSRPRPLHRLRGEGASVIGVAVRSPRPFRPARRL